MTKAKLLPAGSRFALVVFCSLAYFSEALDSVTGLQNCKADYTFFPILRSVECIKIRVQEIAQVQRRRVRRYAQVALEAELNSFIEESL